MRVYLVRHGETAHNRNRVVQGHAEVPLNETGIAQAGRLAQRFEAIPHDRIISSDLRRAVMTAVCIASRTEAPLEYDSGFRERNPGDHTGQSYDEAAEFFLNPQYLPPNGESAEQFAARVRSAFDALANSFGGSNERIVLVTHGMVCEAFCNCFVEGLDAPDARSWGNASITTVDYNGDWEVINLADTSHLDGEGLPSASHRTGA